MPAVHSFKRTTFTRPTHCQHCNKLLWGLARQGLKCSECHYIVHDRCRDNAPSKCGALQTPAEQSLFYLQQKCGDSAESITSKACKDTREPPSWENILKSLEELVVAAVLDQSSTCEYLSNSPPLHPQTTTRNFSRFIKRIGTFFEMRDSVVRLVCWEDSMNTWIAITSYTILCLYPKLLLVVPQFVLLYFLASNRIHPPSEIDSPIAQRHSTGPNKKSTTFASTFNAGLALLSNMDNKDAPEYTRNLQNIQNMMGEYSDIYDAIAQSFRTHASDEQSRLIAIQVVVISTVLTIPLMFLASFNHMLLVIGLAIFIVNSRFAKAWMRVKDCYHDPIEDLSVATLQLIQDLYKREPSEEHHTLSIFQNQRKWGSEFLPKLKTTDKIELWSNLSGAISVPEPANIDPPEGYRWVEGSKWAVDQTGPWQDDFLQIEVIMQNDVME
ncbi:integral peroxisomal membrane peroxin-domain-containing protein [Fennellomyces sp. T-0311]|nr:integral peroxisomal membrane peroxin-domain-containing protein [Fennellomyces sp. T-0311]